MFVQDDVEYDQFCDPNNPRQINFDDILAAARRIAGSVVRTPCVRSHMSEHFGMELYLKHEFLQFTGSCKDRGARNSLLFLTEEEKKFGVVTESLGNYGRAMAYHTGLLGVPCVIIMPNTVTLNKVTKCQESGAHVVLFGEDISQAKSHAMIVRKEKRMTYINGYDHPHVIAGLGTIGIEIMEQLPAVDAVLVPTGGGGLLTGIAVAIKHLKPDAEVYGIETDTTRSMAECVRKGERHVVPMESTIADSLAMPLVGANTFFNVKEKVDKMVVVREEWITRAVMHLVEDERLVVEGAGAAGIAAIMAGLFPHLKGKRVVCVLTGGNIDSTILARTLERGMSAEGRLIKFKVTVNDRPGGMAQLCALLGSIRVMIRDCVPERAWVNSDVFHVKLEVLAETRGWAHAKQLVDLVKKHYRDCAFPDIGDKIDIRSMSKRGPCLAPFPACMRKQYQQPVAEPVEMEVKLEERDDPNNKD